MTAVIGSQSPPVLRNVAGKNPSFLEEAADIVAHSYLLFNLIHRDLTVRYKRSVLGFFWTLLNPFLMMLILVAVFSNVFRFDLSHYETYFLSEYLPWIFFAQTTVGSMLSLAWNGQLMKKVRVPKAIFALSTTLANMINLALSCGPLLVIMVAVGVPLKPALLFLPVSFFILAVFVLGVSLALSSLSVYFDDVAQMYQVAVTGLMYLTPIMYPIKIIPERLRWLVDYNPLTTLFELVRCPIYLGTMPSLRMVGISVALACVALAVGWSIFRRLASGFYVRI
jgi:ABC-type polysaccharide/polyol phosphate export permease